jgi:uncharacterized damage-inducible protein DinB
MSALTDSLIAELENEAATTRRVLERIPEDRLSWAPHAKSMTLGKLAQHIAGIPGFSADVFDAPESQMPMAHPQAPSSRAEVLSLLDQSVANAVAKLRKWGDAYLQEQCRVLAGDRVLIAGRRIELVRKVMLSHWYHHRGQLTVYLRLLDVPVPSVYGPSADEPVPATAG